MPPPSAAPGWNSHASWAGYLLGLALGGFFDGILLHQVLQWHHLLSLAPGEDFQRIEVQVLWDGLFHVLMYAIAVGGLWLLWSARLAFAEPAEGRRLLAAVLIGFGLWNLTDVAAFHWLLGIHRIRVDVPADDRLRWDLLWLALFAAPPLFAAWLVEHRGRAGIAPAAVAAVVVASGALSLRPPPESAARTVVFRADLSAAEAFAAVAAVDGRVSATAGDGRLLSVVLPERVSGWRLYRLGALAVSGPVSPATCLSWSRLPGSRGAA
jgi:uncharacterized membrane protein